ncbi:MAG: hypothetical protein ABSC89_12885 [Verrucomicrobiota bacterium]|jgi:hypothetical protein
MTPEQLQQYVDTALKQRDQFNLVFYPLTIVLSIGGAWLISYFREKGKNLATKEDIAEITRKQEEIKKELGNYGYFSRVRYEHEIELYREVWEKLCVCYEKSALRFAWKIDAPDSKAKAEELQKATQEFFEIIRNKRPFYPTEISDELFKFSSLCSQLVSIQSSLQTGSFQLQKDFLPKLEQVQKETREQFENIENAIRKRLDKFEGLR